MPNTTASSSATFRVQGVGFRVESRSTKSDLEWSLLFLSLSLCLSPLSLSAADIPVNSMEWGKARMPNTTATSSATFRVQIVGFRVNGLGFRV